MRRFLMFVVMVSLALIVAACGGGSSEETEQEDADQSEATEEVNVGGELNIAVTPQPPTLDPHLTTATVALDVTRNIFETLVTSNEDYESVPMLAESIDVSDDGLTYTFELREGVKFHNGKEMTSEDVEASMNRWLENSSRAIMLLEGATFEATDDYTVELHLENRASDTLDIMAGQGQFPAIMPKEVIEEAESDGVQEIVGTGPFKFEEWQQDQYIHLVKFDNYAARDEEPSGFAGKKEALVDDVYYHIVTDPSTRLAGLQTGEYDIADSMPFDNYEQIQNTDNVTAEVFLDGTLNMVYNKKEGFMADEKMRQAINAALDMDAIMMASFAHDELYKINNSYMNPDHINWASEAGSDSYNQNNAEVAKELAEEAGYDGEEITMLVTRDYDYHYNAAVVVQEYLEQAGFNVHLEVYDWATLLESRDDASAWDMFFTGTGYVTTPSQLLVVNSDYAGWTDDETITQLLEEVRGAETQEEATETWEELQAYMWDEYLPTSLFGHYTRIVGASDEVQGLNLFNGILPWNVSINR